MHRRIIAFPLVLALSLLSGSPAQAATTSSVTAKGSKGQVIKVSKTKLLKPSGQKVRIVGNRFDETVGIYVALCVVPKRGQAPSPCGGGVNKSGASSASKWISSNPPPYGAQLAIPFRAGGRFDVTLKLGSRIGKVDCRKVKCAIVVRADHMRADDRSHDLIVPVTFAKK